MNYMSESIKDLATALAKAQSEFKVADKNKLNPFFKSNYADFQSIVASSRSALTKNGLAIMQQIITNPPVGKDDGDQLLVTALLHSSGEWVKSAAKINPPKTDIQAFSSYITYLKRISYASLVGVVTGDEDDDGEAAVAPTRQSSYNSYQKKTISPLVSESVTDDQAEQLDMELRGFENIQTRVLDALKIDHLSQMPKEKFLYSINRIRELKALLTQK